MTAVSIKLNHTSQEIWDFLLVEKNWAQWYETGLKEVKGGWQTGGRLVWESGEESTITNLIEGQSLTFGDHGLLYSLQIESKPKTTQLSLDIQPDPNQTRIVYEESETYQAKSRAILAAVKKALTRVGMDEAEAEPQTTPEPAVETVLPSEDYPVIQTTKPPKSQWIWLTCFVLLAILCLCLAAAGVGGMVYFGGKSDGPFSVLLDNLGIKDRKAIPSINNGRQDALVGIQVLDSWSAEKNILEFNTTWLRDVTNEQYDQKALNTVGKTLTYTADLEKNTLYDMGYSWCASDRSILRDNLDKMDVRFYINDEQLDEKKIAIINFNDQENKWVCQEYGVVVKFLTNGKADLIVISEFKEKINDGETDFGKGKITHHFTINVE